MVECAGIVGGAAIGGVVSEGVVSGAVIGGAIGAIIGAIGCILYALINYYRLVTC